MSKSDWENEYTKEIDTYRSQQVIIKALMEIKEKIGQSEPTVVDLINRIYLANKMKMNQTDVDSLFGTDLSTQPIGVILQERIRGLLPSAIYTQCNEVILKSQQIKAEKTFNVFEIENVKKEIELVLTEYSEKLKQLANMKMKVFESQIKAVNIKAGSAQRKEVELFCLKVKLRNIEIEHLKQLVLTKVCNQVPGNMNALSMLEKFIDEKKL